MPRGKASEPVLRPRSVRAKSFFRLRRISVQSLDLGLQVEATPFVQFLLFHNLSSPGSAVAQTPTPLAQPRACAKRIPPFSRPTPCTPGPGAARRGFFLFNELALVTAPLPKTTSGWEHFGPTPSGSRGFLVEKPKKNKGLLHCGATPAQRANFKEPSNLRGVEGLRRRWTGLPVENSKVASSGG